MCEAIRVSVETNLLFKNWTGQKTIVCLVRSLIKTTEIRVVRFVTRYKMTKGFNENINASFLLFIKQR